MARRSHAERTAETRARLLQAVVESLDEVGFQRTTAKEIAARAGVTWGAVQHHFGGKDGILAAVLEESFGRFAALVEQIDVEGTTLEQRVDAFVHNAWRHFSSPHYRSIFEILRHFRPDDDDGDDPVGELTRRFGRDAAALWKQVFADTALPRRRARLLQHYAVSVLSGLATAPAFDGRSGLAAPEELELLADTLVRELTRADRATAA